MRRALATVLLLGLAACSNVGLSGLTRAEPVDMDYPKGANDRVLSVITTGGFTDLVETAADFPTFVLYGDGRLLTQRFVDYSEEPLLATVEVKNIDDEGVRALLGAARDAQLFGADVDFGNTGLTDQATTTLTIQADQGTHVKSIYGLNSTFGASEVDFAVRSRRLEVQAFIDRLWDPEGWLPKDSVRAAGELEPSSYLLFAADNGRSEPIAGVPPSPAWPISLSLVDLPANADGVKCAVVAPDQAQQLAATFTPGGSHMWAFAGHEYLVFVRPLLPDETGCPPSV